MLVSTFDCTMTLIILKTNPIYYATYLKLNWPVYYNSFIKFLFC